MRRNEEESSTKIAEAIERIGLDYGDTEPEDGPVNITEALTFLSMLLDNHGAATTRIALALERIVAILEEEAQNDHRRRLKQQQQFAVDDLILQKLIKEYRNDRTEDQDHDYQRRGTDK